MGYLIEHGATHLMWERWNGDQMKDDQSMNSYNHYAYGAVADWIYRYAAGVDAAPVDAGFHTIVLHPVFEARLGSIVFDYDSAYGPIHSDWTVTGKTAAWRVSIPPNRPMARTDTARYCARRCAQRQPSDQGGDSAMNNRVSNFPHLRFSG
jgi:alpha-L-rhamnosidase